MESQMNYEILAPPVENQDTSDAMRLAPSKCITIRLGCYLMQQSNLFDVLRHYLLSVQNQNSYI